MSEIAAYSTTALAPDPDLVTRALQHFGLRDVGLELVPEAYSSTVRRIVLPDGERLILKIPYSRQKLLRELTALRALQHDLPVPQIIDAWIPEDDGRQNGGRQNGGRQNGGAMLLSHLPGAIIEGLVTPDLARELGVLLASLHTHRLPWYGETFEPADPAAQDWWEIMRQRFQDWLRFCDGVVAESLLRSVEATYMALRADLPEPDGPCWVHADFRPANVLVVGNRVTGLIDFESARGGSADYDFVKVSLEVWDTVPGAEAAFLSGYDSVRPHPDVHQTLTYYQLHNAVGGLAWCVRRTDTRDPFYAENMAVVERILASRAH